jgi:hypothetical protein
MKNLFGRDFGTSSDLYEASPGWFNDDFVEMGDQDSVVGTTTSYGLDVSEESFTAALQSCHRVHPASCEMGADSLSWG